MTLRRRHFLQGSLAGVAAAVATSACGGSPAPNSPTAAECAVTPPDLSPYAPPGPRYNGTFYSKARGRRVGYTLAYPPGHRPGDYLPLVIFLHGYGYNHANAVTGMTPAHALAVAVAGKPLLPMALVTVDGGTGFWNPHPGDNAQAMLVDELIPSCQRQHLGTGSRQIAATGISMGGYGAILLAEKYPGLLAAVAAISPAILTSYAQAHGEYPTAYASAAAYAYNDAVTHTATLTRTPVRVAVGDSDFFYDGVRTFTGALPATTGGKPPTVVFGPGCHSFPFFTAQEPPSLAFLAQHLAGS